MEQTMIQVSQIEVPERFQRKRPHDTYELVTLRNSIKAIGIRFPLRVRRDGPGRYTLIDGLRRLEAAKSLKLERVPAYVDEDKSADIDLLRHQSNVQRENLKPMEEAELIHALIADEGIVPEEVARMVGKEPSTIRRYLSLVKVIEPWKRLVNADEISIWDVKPLVALTAKGQREALREIRRRKLPLSKVVIASVVAGMDPNRSPEKFSRPRQVSGQRRSENMGKPVSMRKVEGIAELKAVAKHYRKTLSDYEEKMSLSTPIIKRALQEKSIVDALLPSTLAGFREYIKVYG